MFCLDGSVLEHPLARIAGGEVGDARRGLAGHFQERGLTQQQALQRQEIYQRNALLVRFADFAAARVPSNEDIVSLAGDGGRHSTPERFDHILGPVLAQDQTGPASHLG